MLIRVEGRKTVRGGRLGRAALLAVATFASPWARGATDATTEVLPERQSDPAAPQALGRVFAAGPTAPALVLFSSGGYGYTESVLNAGDVHHRAAGSVGVEGRPLDWLGLGLRLDGRYDKHESGAQGTDDGWIGDPRLFVRVDQALGPSLRAGGRIGVWFPGGKAPSVDVDAITPELIGALTWSPSASSLWLTANGGYRLNRSARSAGDAALLSPNDRVGLELSAFNQALVGVAGAYGAGRAQAFAEVTAELMVGAGSPPLSASPIRAGGGMRFAVTPDVRLEAEVEADVGSRPALSMSGPLVPVPPRAAVWLGVGYRFGSEAPKAPPHRPSPVVAPAAPPPAAVKARLDGRVGSADGTAVPEVGVTIRVGAGAEAEAVEVDADGRFTFTGKPGQSVTVQAQAAGYEPASETVTLAAEDATELTLTLKRQLPGGQIRGLVRSFKGVGLAAEIKIDPSDQASRALRTQDGHFEVDVAPGTYDVTITAPGYETQRRRVEVEKNGVTLLNVDLRNAR
jgi:hypothetical protein